MNLRTNPLIPFIDVAAQRRRLGSAVDAAVAKVLNHCQFILGPEVRAFEAELAAFCGARNVVTCASGTDALVLAGRAMRCSVRHSPFARRRKSRFWSGRPRSLSMWMQRRSTSMPRELPARPR